jgi:hypothetical protein
MSWVGVPVALAAIWLLGAATLHVSRVRPHEFVHALVTDFVAGVTVLSAVGMTAVALGFRVSLVLFYVLIAMLVTVATRTRRITRAVRPRLPRGARAIILIGCAFAAILAIALVSIEDRLWWDGWAIWTFKARVLFLEGTLPPAFFASDSGYAFTHLDYPLAVPLFDWWVWRHVGAASPATASFIGAAWFSLLPLLLWSSLRTIASEGMAALAALGMSLFWPIAYYATGGTADVVVALSLLGAVIELERAIRHKETAALVRCGIYVTLGVLAKNEGLAVAAVVTAVGAFFMLRSGERRSKRFLPLALPFVAVAPWWMFVSAFDVREPAAVPSLLATLPERLPILVKRFAALAASVPWLALPLIGVVGVTAAARRRDDALTAGWVALASYFVVLCVVYLLTPHDLEWLLTTSQPRVLSVLVPSLTYLAVASVQDRMAESRVFAA